MCVDAALPRRLSATDGTLPGWSFSSCPPGRRLGGKQIEPLLAAGGGSPTCCSKRPGVSCRDGILSIQCSGQTPPPPHTQVHLGPQPEQAGYADSRACNPSRPPKPLFRASSQSHELHPSYCRESDSGPSSLPLHPTPATAQQGGGPEAANLPPPPAEPAPTACCPSHPPAAAATDPAPSASLPPRSHPLPAVRAPLSSRHTRPHPCQASCPHPQTASPPHTPALLRPCWGSKIPPPKRKPGWWAAVGTQSRLCAPTTT